jgi:hypothetical protein
MEPYIQCLRFFYFRKSALMGGEKQRSSGARWDQPSVPDLSLLYRGSGQTAFGFEIAIITGAGPFLIRYFHLNDLSLGWAFSSSPFGCVLGDSGMPQGWKLLPGHPLERSNNKFLTETLPVILQCGPYHDVLSEPWQNEYGLCAALDRDAGRIFSRDRRIEADAVVACRQR